MTAPIADPTDVAYTPIVQGLPWEVAAWLRRKPGRVVARDGQDVLLIDGPVYRRYPTLTAATAAVAL